MPEDKKKPSRIIKFKKNLRSRLNKPSPIAKNFRVGGKNPRVNLSKVNQRIFG